MQMHSPKQQSRPYYLRTAAFSATPATPCLRIHTHTARVCWPFCKWRRESSTGPPRARIMGSEAWASHCAGRRRVAAVRMHVRGASDMLCPYRNHARARGRSIVRGRSLLELPLGHTAPQRIRTAGDPVSRDPSPYQPRDARDTRAWRLRCSPSGLTNLWYVQLCPGHALSFLRNWPSAV